MSVSRIKLSDLKASLENQEGQAVEVDVKNVEATAVGAPKDASVEAGTDSVKDSSADDVTVGFDDPTEETAEAIRQGEEIHRDLEKMSDCNTAMEGYLDILVQLTDRNETVTPELARAVQIGLEAFDKKYFAGTVPSLEAFGAPTDRMLVSLELMDGLKDKLKEVGGAAKDAAAKFWEWLKSWWEKVVVWLKEFSDSLERNKTKTQALQDIAKVMPEQPGGATTGTEPASSADYKFKAKGLFHDVIPDTEGVKGTPPVKEEKPAKPAHDVSIGGDLEIAGLDQISYEGVANLGLTENNELAFGAWMEDKWVPAMVSCLKEIGTYAATCDVKATADEVEQRCEEIIQKHQDAAGVVQGGEGSTPGIFLGGGYFTTYVGDRPSLWVSLQRDGEQQPATSVKMLSKQDIQKALELNYKLFDRLAEVTVDYNLVERASAATIKTCDVLIKKMYTAGPETGHAVAVAGKFCTSIKHASELRITKTIEVVEKIAERRHIVLDWMMSLYA